MALRLDQMQALMDRAGHPTTPDEEARTCAVKAARAAYGLHKIGGAPSPVDAALRAKLDAAELRQALLGARIAMLEGELAAAREGEAAPKAEPAPRKAAPKAKRPPRGWAPRASTGPCKRVVLESRYRGKCAHCDAKYDIGDEISWCRDEPTYHAACAVEAEKQAA